MDKVDTAHLDGVSEGVKGSVKLECAAFPSRREAGAAGGDHTNLHLSPFTLLLLHRTHQDAPARICCHAELKPRPRKMNSLRPTGKAMPTIQL